MLVSALTSVVLMTQTQWRIGHSSTQWDVWSWADLGGVLVTVGTIIIGASINNNGCIVSKV